MPSRPPRNSRAFTLPEIIVVVVILAIVAAAVVPLASNASSNAMSATRMVAADLEYAQDLAMSTQTRITVSFDPNGLYRLSNASGVLVQPMTKSAYIVRFGSTHGLEGVSILSAAFGSSWAVTFDEMGAPDNGGSVQIKCGPAVYRLDVAAATGNVTVTP